jgi:hypothetical protein
MAAGKLAANTTQVNLAARKQQAATLYQKNFWSESTRGCFT